MRPLVTIVYPKLSCLLKNRTGDDRLSQTYSLILTYLLAETIIKNRIVAPTSVVLAHPGKPGELNYLTYLLAQTKR